MIQSGKINLDKNRVKEVVQSLRHANRELPKSNGITDPADDFIYMSIVLKNPILHIDET